MVTLKHYENFFDFLVLKDTAKKTAKANVTILTKSKMSKLYPLWTADYKFFGIKLYRTFLVYNSLSIFF